MERFFKVSDRNLAVDHSLSQLRDLAREGGCGGGEKDTTDPKSELVTIVKISQEKNEIIQSDFDREKHLSIGLALNEKKSRDIEASLAKIKAAEDKFRQLSEVEQIEVMSNRGDASPILNDILRIKAERKRKSILVPDF